MDTDMVLYSSLVQAVSMTPGDHKGYADQYGPSGQHGLWTRTWLQEVQASGVSMVLTGKRSHEYQHRLWLIQD